MTRTAHRVRGFTKRFAKRGYTAVEVLVALTLFAVGAAGVIGMLRATLQGNSDARRFDLGTSIANEWLGRLRRDSMQWTQPNTAIDTSNIATTTLWLKDVTTQPTPLPTNVGWILPATPTPQFGGSPAFDAIGRELAAGDPPFFCVNYRLDWLLLNSTIRAEVRVFWPRYEQAAPASCDPAVANVANASELFHFVYATSTIRRNAE
jgi:prepilin-type N-terminal cleavage/methylation domain-containing protein